MTIASINPPTGETVKTFEPHSPAEVEQKLQLAAETFHFRRQTSLEGRAEKMTRVAEILESEKLAFGKLMTIEMGKPITAAIGEAEKCAWVCRYYAENAAQHLADEVVKTNAKQSYIKFQ